MNKTRLALGCLGFVLGGGGGLLVGAGGSYAIASLVTSSRETQAYLTLLIVPAIALVGALTVGATLAWLATRTGPLLAVAAPGWLILLGALTLAISWAKVSRPAKVSVPVDLDTPSTFNGLEGRTGDDFVRHHLSDAETTGLIEGDYVWVVGGAPGSLTYRFERAP